MAKALLSHQQRIEFTGRNQRLRQFLLAAFFVAAVASSVAGSRLLIPFLLGAQPKVDVAGEGSHPAWYNGDTLRTISMGHWASWVDWAWIQILQDDSLEWVKRGEHPRMYFDMKLAIDLDPRYYEVYAHGSNLLAVVRSDGQGAREILEKGVEFRDKQLPLESLEFRDRYWQRSWWLSLTLAYVYLFELDDLQSASEQFLKTAEIDGSPPYLGRLVARLEQPGGIYEVGQRLLSFMMIKEDDPKLVRGLERKKRDLQVIHYLHELDVEFLNFLRSRSDYRQTLSVSPEKLQRFWRIFKRRERIDRDPWGGQLSIDANGHVQTDTPYRPVFGMGRKE